MGKHVISSKYRGTQVNTEGPRTLYGLPKTNLENIFDASHSKNKTPFQLHIQNPGSLAIYEPN